MYLIQSLTRCLLSARSSCWSEESRLALWKSPLPQGGRIRSGFTQQYLVLPCLGILYMCLEVWPSRMPCLAKVDTIYMRIASTFFVKTVSLLSFRLLCQTS